MSMIASSSHSDPDSRSLQLLLEVFGSRFSLDDIAAAYCQASQNVDVAGEILFAMTEKTPQSELVKTKGATSKPTHLDSPKEGKAKVWMPKRGSTSVGTISSSIRNVDVAGESPFAVTEKSPQSDKFKMKEPTLKPTHVDVRRQDDGITKVWKQKKGSASIGTVSSVIGKEYVRTRPSAYAPRETTKPLKIDSRDIPETEIWSEEMPESNEANISRVPTNVEEFIVKMLGEGFQASQDVIHQVLGACGYDVKKSTEKLLDLSDTNKYSDVGTFHEIISKVDPQGHGSTSCYQVEPQEEDSQSDGARSLTGSQEGGRDKTSLENEVLGALFPCPERYEEVPKTTRRFGERRARVAGRPVFKPLEEPFQERVVVVKHSPHPSKEDEDDEIEFKALRKAVHEHWHQMKEYYGAAVEAFAKGETERARRLEEKGHFFGQKAREADDKSIAKMLEAKKNDDSTYKEDEVLIVNVNEHETKEALRFLKRQFLYFSGISSFKYFRVKLGDNKEDSKCKRRHNAIAKLLEGESIAWSEEDNGLVMMIRVDEIDPTKLSFAKKKDNQ